MSVLLKNGFRTDRVLKLFPLRAQQTKEERVLNLAVNLPSLAQVSLALKPQLLDDANGVLISRIHISL